MDKMYCVTVSALSVILGASSAYAGVEAVWHFNETSGTVAVDATGNGHNGKLSNVAIDRPGHSGRAYYFNGINAKVVVPNASSLRPGSRNVSISVWYKNSGCPQRDPADCDLWKHGASPDPRTKIEVLHSGMVDCGFAGSKNHIDLVGGPAGGVADGQWHRIECVKTATQVKLIVGTTVFKSTNIVIGDINPNRDATIGASGGSDWTTGLIDEVEVVYN